MSTVERLRIAQVFLATDKIVMSGGWTMIAEDNQQLVLKNNKAARCIIERGVRGRISTRVKWVKLKQLPKIFLGYTIPRIEAAFCVFG